MFALVVQVFVPKVPPPVTELVKDMEPAGGYPAAAVAVHLTGFPTIC